MEMDIFDAELNWWDKLTGPFCRLWWKLCNQWKNFGYRRQRFQRGYASCDVWELRTWFVNTLKPMLEDLWIHHTGHPSEINNQEWECILREMVRLLSIMDIWDDSVTRKHLSISENDRTSKAEMQISTEKQKATEQFFTLFSKWFWDLWD